MLNSNELILKIREYKEMKRMSEEIKDEMTLIEDIIKGELAEKDVEQLIVGEYKIRWTTITSNKLDSKKLKDEYSDIYSAYVKESVSKRFSIV